MLLSDTKNKVNKYIYIYKNIFVTMSILPGKLLRDILLCFYFYAEFVKREINVKHYKLR